MYMHEVNIKYTIVYLKYSIVAPIYILCINPSGSYRGTIKIIHLSLSEKA